MQTQQIQVFKDKYTHYQFFRRVKQLLLQFYTNKAYTPENHLIFQEYMLLLIIFWGFGFILLLCLLPVGFHGWLFPKQYKIPSGLFFLI